MLSDFPDIFNGSQVAQEPHIPDTGEQRLLMAMLGDAIKTATRPALQKKHGDREKHDAIRWIQSDDNDHIFTFINVCETLGVDPDWLRKEIGPLPKVVVRERIAKPPKPVKIKQPSPRLKNAGPPRPNRRCRHFPVRRSWNRTCARGWQCRCCAKCACG